MSSGPYFNGMCLDELAAMYPYRVPAIMAGLTAVSAGMTPAEWTAYIASLPTSPPATGGPWNNNGVPNWV